MRERLVCMLLANPAVRALAARHALAPSHRLPRRAEHRLAATTNRRCAMRLLDEVKHLRPLRVRQAVPAFEHGLEDLRGPRSGVAQTGERRLFTGHIALCWFLARMSLASRSRTTRATGRTC